MLKFKEVITIATVSLLVISCSDLLDEDIRSQVGDHRFNTPEGFSEALNAAYTPLRTYYGTERGHALTEGYGVDIFHEGADGSHKFYNFYGTQLNSDAALIRELWNDMYEGINIANTVLNRGQSVEGLNEDELAIRLGEARFLRAHYYFILVQQYGALHITTEETTGVEVEASRSPVDVVFALIEDDLVQAISSLPDESNDYGRATKPAAEHLLARVLLTRASEYYRADAGGSDDDYDRAADLAKTVIDNYDFSLVDDVANIWSIDNQRNEEVVWSVQYSDNSLLNAGGNTSHMYYLTTYDELPGMNRTVEYGRPWKRFRPTEYLYDDLLGPDTRDKDARYSAFFRDVFLVSTPGTFTVNGVDNVEMAMGDTAAFFPGVEWTEEEKQAKPYTVFSPSDYNPRDYLSVEKHRDPNRSDLNATEGVTDFLAFRLAETHLIAAEALLLGNGSAADATEHINVIRRRAAWPGKEVEMEIDVDELDLDSILAERGRELLGEQFRWYDLKRTGLLLERAYEHNPEVRNVGLMQDHHQLRPIPQDQIDRTEGGESAFPQNKDY
ncbi:MAG: RagB/SusD family nutrient uptake outer membrane protein [Balneolales bacterium]